MWVLRGSVRWYSNGLVVPRLRKETNQYFEENDIVALWLQCNTENSDKKTARAVLYKNYKQWCEQTENHASSAKEFNSLLQEKRYMYIIGRGGDRLVSGLSLAKHLAEKEQNSDCENNKT